MARSAGRAGLRSHALTEALAFAAWLGAALVVLSDGRRGLALGLGLVGAALAGLAFATSHQPGGIALLAGGLVAAGLRLRGGPESWGLMEPGSTPRIILTVVTGLFSLWIAVTVATGDQASLRFAVLAVLGLGGARVLQAREQAASMTAISSLALALGAAAAFTGDDPGLTPYVIAAAIAAAGSALSPAQRIGT